MSHDFRLVQAQSTQEGLLRVSQLAVPIHGTPLVPWVWPNYLLPNLSCGLTGPHREERYRRLQRRYSQLERSTLGLLENSYILNSNPTPFPSNFPLLSVFRLWECHQRIFFRIMDWMSESKLNIRSFFDFAKLFLARLWRRSRGWKPLLLELSFSFFFCFQLRQA